MSRIDRGVKMFSLHRRRLLASLLSAAVAPSSFLLGSSVAGACEQRRSDGVDDREFPRGCLIAWESSNASEVSIDFWTARVSEIEVVKIPTFVRRVVVWDDIFSLRRASKNVAEIEAGIKEWFGFDCRIAPNGSALHLAGTNSLDETLAKVLQAKAANHRKSARIALIDVGSCGVTALDWLDIIPRIRPHYDLVVGVSHAWSEDVVDFPLQPIGDGKCFVSPPSWLALMTCDVAVLTSDYLLSGQLQLYADLRTMPLMDMVRRFAVALADQHFRKELCELPTRPRVFAMECLSKGTRSNCLMGNLESRRLLVTKQFGQNTIDQPIKFDDCVSSESSSELPVSIALWPIPQET